MAAYVFSGSKPGMMRQLFSDRRRGFSAQAGQVMLGRLGALDLAEYISARFSAHGREIGDAIGTLLDTADGHPQRAMLLAYQLFKHTPPQTNAHTDTWSAALRSAFLEVDGEIQEAWRALSQTQQRLAALVAGGTVIVSSNDAQARFGLTRGGRNVETLQRMAAEAIVVADDGTTSGWRVTDPLFAVWLRNGRSWPTT